MSPLKATFAAAIERNLDRLATQRERLIALEEAATPPRKPVAPEIAPSASLAGTHADSALRGYYASIADGLARAQARTAALHVLAAEGRANGATPATTTSQAHTREVIDVEVVEIATPAPAPAQSAQT